MHSRREGWVASLRRFASAMPAPIPRCDLCAQPLAERHPHLFDAGDRRLVCACQPCAILMTGDNQRLQRVPDDASRLADVVIDDARWSAVGIPVGIAFFVKLSGEARITALYPGAAGIVESTLDLAAWSSIEHDNPSVAALRPDVEALFVNHLDGARDYYRMPVDRCYALATEIRTRWEGFTGGDGVRRVVAEFLEEAA